MSLTEKKKPKYENSYLQISPKLSFYHQILIGPNHIMSTRYNESNNNFKMINSYLSLQIYTRQFLRIEVFIV